jgi:hypothetical protein
MSECFAPPPRFAAEEKKPGWQKTGFLCLAQEKKPGWQKTGFQCQKKRNPVGKKPGFSVELAKNRVSQFL